MMQTVDRVAELIVTMQEFSGLLETETKAVKAADAKTVASLLERKQFLALHCRRQMACLADNGAELKTLDAKVRGVLRQHWQGFNEAIAANALALSVAQKATRQVVDLIVDAMRRDRNTYTETTYGRSYRKSAEAHPTASGFCSVTFNRVL
jgi:hypothetical protein